MDGPQETKPDSKKPRIPTGLRELLLDLTEKVVFARPENVFLFCAKYLETLVSERDKSKRSTQQHSLPSGSVTSSPTNCSQHDLPVSVTGHESIFKLTASSHERAIQSVLSSSLNEEQDALKETYGILPTKNDSPQPSHEGRQRDSPVQLASTQSRSQCVVPVVERPVQESAKVEFFSNKFLANTTVLGTISSRLSLQFVPRPPNSRPPNRPARTWTAQMLSRLNGRARCLRTAVLAPDSSQQQPLLQSLPASVHWQGEHVADHSAGLTDSEGCDDKDRSGTVGHCMMYDSDEELNDVDSNAEWWLDGIESKLFKGSRRRKKPLRNDWHKGIFRPSKRREIVYSYDSFSNSHLRVLVYVDDDAHNILLGNPGHCGGMRRLIKSNAKKE